MDERVKKYRQLSPERAKVWREKSPKYHQIRKVPVVYYLCRNRQLEHPHFMEVQLSSLEGLYLRDVLERLNVLRGRGMASMYSWSCKRSYKNGYVWNDLCEDDLILPVHGNEYILKGSEILEDSSPDQFSPARNVKLLHLKQLPEAASCRSKDDSSSSSSLNGRETKHSQEDELSPVQLSGSSVASPEYRGGKNASWNSSLSLTEYKIYKSEGLADASTQTEENVSRPKTRETSTIGSSIDITLENDGSETTKSNALSVNNNSEIQIESASTPSSSSCTSSSGEKIETLETLIKADASKMNRFRIPKYEHARMSSNPRLKATSILLQLISCGSISVKDHNFGLIPTYRPNFTSKFSTPLFSTSMMLGDLDSLSRDPRLIGLKLEDKEYYSGSLIEAKMFKGEGNKHAALKRSSSFDADRTTEHLNFAEDQEDSTSGQSKCYLRSIKSSLAKQPRSESMRSPLSDKPGKSSNGANSSNGGSKRIGEHLSDKKSSKGEDSFREGKEKVTKVEERLASGARIIIQSQEPYNAAG